MRFAAGRIRLDRRAVYGLTALAAAAVRIAALYCRGGSPLAHFSELPGLDMRTHLELGALFAEGEGVFALYRLAAALVPSAAGLAILQSFCGVAAAVLTCFIALRFFGNRCAALFAGLLAALYGNAVLYELVTLPETLNTLVALGAFAALLQARRRRFAPGWSVLAGVLLALTATGRPTGVVAVAAALVWSVFYLRRKRALRRFAFLALGLALVWGPVTLRNARHGWPLPVYGGNFAYAAAVAEQSAVTSWNVAPTQTPSPWRAAVGFLRKMPLVFSLREIPDNLNYYFLKEKLSFMRFTVPVALFGLLAVAGIALALVRRDRKGIFPLCWLLALAAVFTLYFPAGRYRLALYPYFAVFGGYWLAALCRPGRGAALLAFALVAAVEFAFLPHPEVRRAADHTAWALALLRSHGDPAAVDREFAAAVRLSGGGVRETARLLHRLITTNRPHEARKLLREYPGSDPYRKFYDALLDLGDGNALTARRKLGSLGADAVPELGAQYEYFLGEACLRSGAKPEAAAAFRKLLKRDLAPAQRAVIKRKLAEAEFPEK